MSAHSDGSVTFDGPTNLAGNVTGVGISFAAPVTFDGVGNQSANAGTGTLSAADTVTKSTAGALSLAAETLIDAAADITGAGAVNLTGPATLSGDISGVGVTLTGAMTFAGVGNQTVDANAGTLTATGTITKSTAGNLGLAGVTGVNLTGAVSVSGGNFTADGPLSSHAVTASGTVTANDPATLAGNVTGELGVTFNDTVTLADNVTVSSGTAAGDVTFASTVDADAAANNHGLTITAGTGSVFFQDNVGASQPLASLTVTGSTNITLHDVTTRHGQSYTATGTITLSSDYVNTIDGDMDFLGPVVLDSDATVTSDGGAGNDIHFGNTIQGNTAGGEALTVRSSPGGTGTGLIRFGGSVGNTTNLMSLTADTRGTIEFAGTSVATANDISLNVNAALASVPHAATIFDTTGNLTFSTTDGDFLMGPNQKLTLTHGNLVITAGGVGREAELGDLTVKGNIALTAATIDFMKRAGGQVTTSSGSLITDRGVDVVGGGSITATGTLTSSGTGNEPIIASTDVTAIDNNIRSTFLTLEQTELGYSSSRVHRAGRGGRRDQPDGHLQHHRRGGSQADNPGVPGQHHRPGPEGGLAEAGRQPVGNYAR